MQAGNVKFEFAHVGINARTPEEGQRMRDFFHNTFGYGAYREIPAGYFSEDNRMECLKGMGKGTFGHLGFFVDNMPEAIKYLEGKGYSMDYEHARYEADGKTIKLIFLNEEINGFRIHITKKEAPYYVEYKETPLPVVD